MYEIIDDKGVIHSGNEIEMSHAFIVMTNENEYSKAEVEKWGCSWTGDLKLVHVIEISR